MPDETPAAAASDAESLPELVLRLPGRWWQVPLHDQAEARTSLRGLVREQLGAADERARLRDALTRRMLESLEAAISGGGQSMHVALDIVPRIPLPATVTVSLVERPLAPSVGTASERVLEVLDRGLVAAEVEGLESRFRVAAPGGEAIRVHRVLAPTVEDDEEVTPRTLIADYWLAVPGTKRVVVVSCSTALAELQDEMLGLFDAIVVASRWRDRVPASASR